MSLDCAKFEHRSHRSRRRRLTSITRDVFGKPLSLTRTDTALGTSTTRSYVYDSNSNQRLCKRVEPESGATLMDYDGANNVVWSAEGTALTVTVRSRHLAVS